MKVFKGTKGKRKVRFVNPDGSETDNGECDFFVEAIESKNHIGKIEILMDDFGEHSGYPREQKLADAKLDVAAPELLEALQGFVNLQDIYIPSGKISPEHQGEAIAIGEALMKAKSAIEKALK